MKLKLLSTSIHYSLNNEANPCIPLLPFITIGSAKGFNAGLRALYRGGVSNHSQWVFVVNSDIAFYPGVLRRVAKHTYKALKYNSTFGVGFTSLCCGSEWSAVLFTKRMVDKIGFFDENFYPAYYEDDDYGIRIRHSNYKAFRYDNTPLLHGEIDGSKDYLSGLFVQLYLCTPIS